MIRFQILFLSILAANALDGAEYEDQNYAYPPTVYIRNFRTQEGIIPQKTYYDEEKWNLPSTQHSGNPVIVQ